MSDQAESIYRRIFLKEFVEAFLAAVLVAVILRVFFVSVYRVPTESMQPALLPGDFILAWKTSYGVPVPLLGEKFGTRDPLRGDVVVFQFAEEPALYVKRVVGIPGDRISIRDGRLKVNDLEVTGTPIRSAPPITSMIPSEVESWQEAPETAGSVSYRVIRRVDSGEADFLDDLVVPPGHVFLLGDYRSESVDSRHWGPVPVSQIEGRVAVVAFSLELSRGVDNRQGVPSAPETSASAGMTEEALRPTGRVRWSRILQTVK